MRPRAQQPVSRRVFCALTASAGVTVVLTSAGCGPDEMATPAATPPRPQTEPVRYQLTPHVERYYQLARF